MNGSTAVASLGSTILFLRFFVRGIDDGFRCGGCLVDVSVAPTSGGGWVLTAGLVDFLGFCFAVVDCAGVIFCVTGACFFAVVDCAGVFCLVAAACFLCC